MAGVINISDDTYIARFYVLFAYSITNIMMHICMQIHIFDIFICQLEMFFFLKRGTMINLAYKLLVLIVS